MGELEWLEIIATVLAILGSLILILRSAGTGFRKHMEYLFDRDFAKIDNQFNEVRVSNASLATKLEAAMKVHDEINDKLDGLGCSSKRIEENLAKHDRQLELMQLWAKSTYHALIADDESLRTHLPDPDDYFKQPKP
jgi:hypothetical protein